jgi:hypothetical protein
MFQDGLMVGISSGAAVEAALRIARRPQNAGRTVVVVIPVVTSYLSTVMFDDIRNSSNDGVRAASRGANAHALIRRTTSTAVGRRNCSCKSRKRCAPTHV